LCIVSPLCDFSMLTQQIPLLILSTWSWNRNDLFPENIIVLFLVLFALFLFFLLFDSFDFGVWFELTNYFVLTWPREWFIPFLFLPFVFLVFSFGLRSGRCALFVCIVPCNLVPDSVVVWVLITRAWRQLVQTLVFSELCRVF